MNDILIGFLMGISINASITALWIFALCKWGFLKLEWIDRSIKI